MSTDWRMLPGLKSTKPLLYRARFEQSSYFIDVTDFAIVWSEQVYRDTIVRRAREHASDIHPEDESSQMQILLEKLRSALEGAQGTELFVRHLASKLELYLTVPLPGGLADLRWSMLLDAQPASALQADIVNPLLALSFVQQQQIEQLAHLLGEKDVAIGKILDKIDSLGMDYATVFPNARLNRKRPDLRDQVMRQVRGLSAFDKEKWQTTPTTLDTSDMSPDLVLPKALAGIGATSVQQVAEGLPVQKEAASHMPPPRRHSATKKAPKRSVPTLENQASADDFQRQTTPERAAHANSTKQAPKHTSPEEVPPLRRSDGLEDDGDETTDDEEDLDAGMAPSQPKSTPVRSSIPAVQSPQPAASPELASSPPSRPAQPRKLGAVGVRHTPHAQRSVTRSVSPDGDSAAPQLETTVTPERARLGAIGASKRPPPDTPQSDADGDVTMPETTPTPSPAPKRKLGAIGNSRAKDEPAQMPDRGSATPSHDLQYEPEPKSSLPKRRAVRTASPPPAAPAKKAEQEEEDPKLKADKKREALKRNLDAAKPGPKKKRRF